MWLAMWLACGQEMSEVELSKGQEGSTSSKVESVDMAKDLIQKDALKKGAPKPVATPVEGKVFFVKDATQVVGVMRTATTWTPQIAVNTLYKGPLESESTLSLPTCQSTGATIQSIEDGIAKVQLEGGCGGCGSIGIYDVLVPTLKAFDEVSTVQIFDPRGKSQIDDPKLDARPGCLEP